MKAGSIHGFIFRTVAASTMLLPLLVLYIIVDPFGVARSHVPCPSFKSAIPFNKGYLSTCAYIENRELYHFNAFIFGSSRTINFRAADWAKHIGPDARIFHFDASDETIEGVYKKVKFIDNHGDTIKYALLEIHPRFFDDAKSGISFRMPWQLDGVLYAPEFHYYYLNRFLDWSMFRCVLNYKLNGQMPPYEIADKVQFLKTIIDGYDSVTNETYFNARDSLYLHHPEMGLAPIYDYSMFHEKGRSVTLEQTRMMEEVKEIFSHHGTEYKIILGPSPDYGVLQVRNHRLIESVFGLENVVDLGRFPAAFNGSMTFYDDIHFTPEVGRAMLDAAYGF